MIKNENVVYYRLLQRHRQGGAGAGKMIVETIAKETYPRTLVLGTEAVRFARGILQKKLSQAEWTELMAADAYGKLQ